MRLCYDSTSSADLPTGKEMYAGYVDGRYQTVTALRKKFRKATIVTITVLGTPGAHVCDTEPGNIGVTGAVKWAKAEIKAGRKPTLYCMASMWPQVKTAVANAGISGQVAYWIASYDGKAQVPAGAVAKQHLHGDANHPGSYSGGHYDVSVVADYWPGVDPEPAVKANPLTTAHRNAAVALTAALEKRDRPLPARDVRVMDGLIAAARHARGVKG